MQSQHVIATVKHFAANNQETNRGSVDVKVSDKALNEIYYPAFKSAVQNAGVGAVMCSYNRVNGDYACENGALLSTALGHAWGFVGFVMSDWGATHSTAKAANAGLDVEMPGARTAPVTSATRSRPPCSRAQSQCGAWTRWSATS